MPTKCPCCGEEITYLKKYEVYERKYTVCLDDETGEPLEDFIDEYEVDEELDYECPKCDGALFHTEEEAISFLRGDHVIIANGVVEETGQVPGEAEDSKEEAIGNP